MGNRRKGVYDPGAVSPFGEEHAEVERVAIEARTALQTEIPVILTPDDASILEVVRFVNDEAEPGDFLLVLHLNSAASRLASGTEVIYSHKAPDARLKQAKLLSSVIAEVLGIPNRGAKLDTLTPAGMPKKGMKGGLPILRETHIPALLIEFCFVSNPADMAAFHRHGTDALVAAIRALKESA